MTSLAGGIKDFANLTFTTFDVKDGKIIPIGVTKLDSGHFTDAATNFGLVTDAILGPISRVGEEEMKKSNWFSGGSISKGVESLTGIGNIMSGLAGGVRDFANLTFTTFKVVNGEIVPEKITKLTSSHFISAGIGFGAVLDAILLPISKVGEAEMNSEGWFSGGAVSKGIESLTGIGNIMSGMAKGVQDFANLTFTTFEVKDGKVVPKSVITLSDADFTTAADNFDRITSSMLTGIINAGKLVEENEDEIEDLMDLQEDILSFMKGVTTFATDWSKVTNPVALGVSFDWFVKKVMGVFDPKQNPTKNLAYFMIFADKLSLLSKSSEEFEQMADSFERIADSMGDFKDNLNGLDKDILIETRGLFDAMAVISKSDSGDKFIKKYSESLKKTFETLAKLLEEFKGSVDQNTTAQVAATTAVNKPAATAAAGKTTTTPGAPGAKGKEAAAATPPAPVDMSGVINAIKALQSTLTTQGIKVKNDTFN
jgi:hypothetical protein